MNYRVFIEEWFADMQKKKYIAEWLNSKGFPHNPNYTAAEYCEMTQIQVQAV